MKLLCVSFFALIIGMVLMYWILKDGCSNNPKLNYGKKHNVLEKATYSVVLYVTISLLVILFWVEFWNPCINKVLEGVRYKKEFIDSGLCFAIMMPLVGGLIQCLYNYIYQRLNKICQRQYLYKLELQETKWSLVVSCIILAIIGWIEKNIDLTFSCIALIVGKFCWFDYNSKQISEEIREILKLPIFIMFVLGISLAIGVFMFIDENYAIIPALFLAIGIALGLVLYVYSHKE